MPSVVAVEMSICILVTGLLIVNSVPIQDSGALYPGKPPLLSLLNLFRTASLTNSPRSQFSSLSYQHLVRICGKCNLDDAMPFGCPSAHLLVGVGANTWVPSVNWTRKRAPNKPERIGNEKYSRSLTTGICFTDKLKEAR